MSDILHIGAKKATLTKRQKEFNQLTLKIEALTVFIHELEEGQAKLGQRFQKEMKPLHQKLDAVSVELVMTMDRIYSNSIFKKTDHKKLAHLITELCFDLITKRGKEELKEIFNKYNDEDFDTVNSEVDRLALETAKTIASVYGIEFDEEISSPEQFREHMNSKMFEQEEAYENERRKRQEKQAAKPKTQKQIEREENRKAEEQKLTKSVRGVYMDLVKAFHPDREKDELEKKRKTEIMQRVTQAYQENDLMKLLKLQMELERIDQTHLETLADDQLRYYNKVLKQQLQDLEERRDEITEELAHIIQVEPYRINSVESVFFAFNRQLTHIKKHVKDMKSDLGFWGDPASVKAYLKTYQIPKDDDFDFF